MSRGPRIQDPKLALVTFGQLLLTAIGIPLHRVISSLQEVACVPNLQAYGSTTSFTV